jgi:Fur family ferric uptake transcriptional regulator
MRQAELQLTPQRAAVLEAVREAKRHVDAAEVFQMVRSKLPRISLGTVYRSLGALAEAGLVHQIDNGSGPALYDGNLDPHQHIVCRRCGRVADLDISIANGELDEAARRSGFASVEHSRVDFHGICRDCA